MGFDPYFTSAGSKTITVYGDERAEYSAVDRAAAQAMLDTPDRVVTFDQIKEKLRRREKLTAPEICFFHLMKRRKKILSHRPIRLLPRRLESQRTNYPMART